MVLKCQLHNQSNTVAEPLNLQPLDQLNTCIVKQGTLMNDKSFKEDYHWCMCESTVASAHVYQVLVPFISYCCTDTWTLKGLLLWWSWKIRPSTIRPSPTISTFGEIQAAGSLNFSYLATAATQWGPMDNQWHARSGNKVNNSIILANVMHVWGALVLWIS